MGAKCRLRMMFTTTDSVDGLAGGICDHNVQYSYRYIRAISQCYDNESLLSHLTLPP